MKRNTDFHIRYIRVYYPCTYVSIRFEISWQHIAVDYDLSFTFRLLVSASRHIFIEVLVRDGVTFGKLVKEITPAPRNNA